MATSCNVRCIRVIPRYGCTFLVNVFCGRLRSSSVELRVSRILLRVYLVFVSGLANGNVGRVAQTNVFDVVSRVMTVIYVELAPRVRTACVG